MMIVREIKSLTRIAPIPTRQTHGRLLRKSSPRNIETRFGTMSPRNGKFPMTVATTPTDKAMSPVAIIMS